jgi:hypothetical protein
LKIRKPTLRSIKSSSAPTIEKKEEHLRIESTEAIDRTDRFEVGTSDKNFVDEERAEDADILLQESIDDPTMYREVGRAALLGLDELPYSIETSITGIINLLDTERDD